MRTNNGRLIIAMAAIVLLGATACSANAGSNGNAGRPTAASVVPTPSSITAPTVQTTPPSASTSTTDKPSKSSESSESSESTKKGKPQSSEPVPAAPGTADTTAVSCPGQTATVNDAASLTAALSAAEPGSVIQLEDGNYEGTFAGGVSGTEESPIWLCGGPGAVIDAGSIKDGYAFHLKDVKYWRLVGFSVRNAQKGVIVDNGANIVVQGLTVSAVGDEAIHLRAGTTYSVVRDNDVSDTGKRNEKYGEGIYIGSASSNWCTYSACGPDRSNNNAIIDNNIHATTAESIDIKEGTQDGLIQGNTFDGAGGLTGADSWVDVKGNGWQIIDNAGANSPVDGFQVHSVVDGWGMANVFKSNTADVNGSGYGFKLAPVQDNTVYCDNQASGAGSGTTNTPCVQ